jgi:hypothetical protein
MAMMTVDEYIASLNNFKEQFGGDAVLLCFDRLLDAREVEALSVYQGHFDSVYSAMDQIVIEATGYNNDWDQIVNEATGHNND